MNIDDSIKKTGGLPVGKTQVRQDKTSEKSNVGTAAASTVQTSTLSSQMQALQGKLAETSTFDAKKVEAIKLAIANGEFKVNAEKVADELLATVRELLQPPKN